ncbi:hypothetical protein [Asticcacaulis excentricus]|uniref:Uncharacterized protein n=1 Tax=Asticcacaulis excentricus (strain ATCC 15261 / DSM 4724 / KCTC 12464 / NCIMB 9791 / VKM B-1370 / CB 48) TaxID=573065 RepID=E8RN78_ASTEC|nr:hypothetical protein [Asticcacaulis excentricus]ADU13977.1 hypothetical protein Astex_2323 [Asticcacaulis excentricus CB 48]
MSEVHILGLVVLFLFLSLQSLFWWRKSAERLHPISVTVLSDGFETSMLGEKEDGVLGLAFKWADVEKVTLEATVKAKGPWKDKRFYHVYCKRGALIKRSGLHPVNAPQKITLPSGARGVTYWLDALMQRPGFDAHSYERILATADDATAVIYSVTQ